MENNTQNFSSSTQALAALALWLEGENAASLFVALPHEQKKNLESFLLILQGDLSVEAALVRAQECWRKLSQPNIHSYLADVHSDWLVDELKNESPAIVAAILNHLPADRVREILEGLPSDLKNAMPKWLDTAEADVEILAILQRQFENRFRVEVERPPLSGMFDVRLLPHMRSLRLREFLMAVGYREIALALQGLPESTRHLVLQRLSGKDRLKVEEQQVKDAPRERVKKAQIHLVQQESQQVPSEVYCLELGFLLLSKCLLMRELADFDVFRRKFSRREVALFDSLVKKHVPENSEASVLPLREELQGVAQSLAERKN